MKNKSRNKILATALAVVLCTTSLLTGGSLTASAAGIEAVTPTTFVADRLGTTNTIYFGQNNLVATSGADGDGNPIKWRVVANDGTTITLLADQSLGKRQYDPKKHYLWFDSDICNYLNGTKSTASDGKNRDYTNGGFLKSSFSAAERSAMVAKYSTTQEQGYNASDKYTANQTMVLPSVEEVEDSGSWGFKENAERTIVSWASWWLRSAGSEMYNAAIVMANGSVNSKGISVNNFIGIRPAFKIHLSSVIFSSSAASGGKPTQVGANLEAAQQPTAEIKLTVIDTNTSNLNLNIADTSARTAVQGETIGIDYTGAVTGADKFVSCVVENNTGIKYYAKLATVANAADRNGTASINIPANMPVGSYTIKLFNEQCNLANYTDFASDPISIGLTVTQAPVSPTINGAVAGNTRRTVTLGYSSPVGIDFAVAGTPAPSLNITNAGGTAAAVSGNRLTIPTGLASGDYAIELTATNSQGSATHTVNFKVSALPITYHTVTVNAGTGGAAAGGGSYGENDTATVTATPTAGYSFVNWTENGVVVSTEANYSFTVTAPRTLTAVFEEIPPTIIPEPPTVIPEPPIIVYPSGGGGSSSGGSKAPDKSTNTGGTTTGSTSKPVTKQEAEKAVDNAIAQLPAGAKEVVVTLKNPSGISKEALDIIAKKAAAAGVTPVVHLDTVVGGKVTGRITLRGGAKGFGVAALDATFNLTRAQMIEKLFRKYFSNNLFAVCLNQQGELGATASIAVPLPAGMGTENLVVYSYDSATNKYFKLDTKVRVDSNGYVHFDTTIGGDFIVSNGALVKR